MMHSNLSAEYRHPSLHVISDFWLLMKPELTSLSVFSAVACAYLALPVGAPFPWLLFVYLALGTLLAGGGAGALNQFYERKLDAAMKRTHHRPLASGSLDPREGFWFGVTISIAGVGLLALTVNLLAACLTAATVVTYLYLYTPLKRISSVSTIVGAIPGALPTLIGWTAVRNEISIPAVMLFAILYYWQMPHFYALAWLYRNDYAKGGFKLLSTIDVSGTKIVWYILANQMILLFIGCLPFVVGLVSAPYVWGAAAAGIGFLLYGMRLAVSIAGASSQTRARQLFFASLAYLPIILILLIAFKK
jgi:heme o synthase